MRVGTALPIASAVTIFLVPSSSSDAAAQVPMPVTFESVFALSSRPPDGEVRYGPATSQRAAWWRPSSARVAGARAPVVVLIHGGCWLSQYGVDHAYPLATALAAEGFAVWAPEYRRVGEPGGGWPGTFEDAMAGIDALGDGDQGDWDLDRVALVGHSAGGHLALWAAARGGFAASHPFYREDPLTPRGAIGLAGITDLAASAAGEGSCAGVVPTLLGGSPAEVPERYRLASPAHLPRRVPLRIIHGDGDSIVPLSQARAIPGADVRIIEGAGHFDLIHPGTPAFPVLLEELRNLLTDG